MSVAREASTTPGMLPGRAGRPDEARAGGRYSRHSVFYRFLLTYLVVLFVPIFILTVFQYAFYFNILKSQILNEKQQSLERSAELIEQQFDQLQRIVLRMSLSADFRPFDFDALPYDGYALVRAISSYVYDESFSESIFVHFKDDRYVYTSYNAQRVDEFTRTHVGSEALFDRIVGADGDRSFHASGGQIILAARFPAGLPLASYGTIMFFFGESLLSSFFTDPATVYEIVDAAGRTIYASRDDLPERFDDVVLTYRSSGGLLFRNRIRADRFSGDLVRYRNAYLVVIALILAVSFPLVYLVAVSQFNPIERLTRFVRQITGSDHDPNGGRPGNELQLIQEEISDYVHKINPAVKTQLVYDLLNGKIETTGQIYARSREMELNWQATRHTVMILRWRDQAPPDPDWYERFAERSGRSAGGAVEEVLVHQSPQDNQVVFILGSSGSITRSDIHALLGVGNAYPCGCGSLKHSPELLNTAYAEAQRALEYCLVSGTDDVVFYDEIGEGPAVAPRDRLDALNAALELGDLARVEESFADLQAVIHEGTFSLFDIKMVYYELLNMAVRINEKWQYPDTFQIENTDSIEEVLGLIQRIVASALHEQQSANPVPDFVNRLQHYIDEHYANRMLSLKLLEDEFGYSLAYISRSFKKHKGVNISSYIASLRLNRAKELLRNSDLSIGDIIASVGYSDSSAFSRTFRAHEGMTPGAYRSRYQ